MLTARRDVFARRSSSIAATPCVAGSPRRAEAEAFVRTIFARRYGATVSSFAPNLLLFTENDRVVAATGWRSAASEVLFLERYFDQPIENAVAQPTNRPVSRACLVEVCNLAAVKHGSTVHVVSALACHLDQLGYEWVVFTATRELLGIFARLGLPLLALAPADPACLGDEARAWGQYYESQPVVVAGRIRVALERIGRCA